MPEGYASLTEGQATILQQGNEVFYNPAQVQLRASCAWPAAAACQQQSHCNCCWRSHPSYNHPRDLSSYCCLMACLAGDQP